MRALRIATVLPPAPAPVRRRAPASGRITLESVGLAVVIFNALMPYLNYGPISAPSQVQPWAALCAWAYVVVRAVTLGVKIDATQWILLAFSLWFMLYVYEGEGFDLTVYFRRSAAFLLSAGIFIAARYLTPSRLWNVLKVTLAIWFAFAVLRYVSAGLYFALVTPLVPTVVNSVARGSSSLAPEATDFGFTMAFMIGLCLVTRTSLHHAGQRAERWPLGFAIGGALLSKSGTGFFAMTLILLLYLADGDRARGNAWIRYAIFVLAGVAAFFVLGSLPETGIRGVDLLSSTIRSPGDLMDSTASYRFVHNAVGMFGFLDSGGMGFGAGSFTVEGLHVYNRHNLGSVFGLSGYYAQNVPETLTQSPIAFFPVILLEFGVVGLVYIIYLFRFAAASRIPHKTIAVAIMVVTWAQSFPAAWPPFWVMLGLMMNPHFAVRPAVGAAARATPATRRNMLRVTARLAPMLPPSADRPS